MDWVYRKASRYCIIFASESYAKKVWTNHERSSAQARAIEENSEYVLPARFDDTEIPGIRPTIGYLDISKMTPAELVQTIQIKLGPRRIKPGFPRNVDRLYKALGLEKAKLKAERREAYSVASSFYQALRRMTVEERTAVAGLMKFGCRGELPAGVHISLDKLSRMTEMAPAELMDALAGIRALNFKVIARDAAKVHRHVEGELRKDDTDLLLSFWSQSQPKAKDPTRVAFDAVRQAARRCCAEHALETIVSLDFHAMSGSEEGPVTGERQHTSRVADVALLDIAT